MKKITRLYTLIAILIMAGAVFAGVSIKFGFFGLSTETERASEDKEARLPKADRGEEGEEGDITERLDWFLQQRLYGLGEIPAEARQKAQEEANLTAPSLDRSSAPAAVWNSVGPMPINSLYQSAIGNLSGRINWIAVHPTDNNIVLLGTATGGIWRSTNALATTPTFTPVSDNQIDLAVGSIAFAPSNPNIVYAAMGDQDNSYFGTGVLKSTDAGATWTRLSAVGILDKGFGIQIAVSNTDANQVYLLRGLSGLTDRNHPSITQEGGFYRSTDGGANWTRTLNGKMTSFAVAPLNAGNPNSIYAVVLASTQTGAVAKGIYISPDNGATFQLENRPNTPTVNTETDFRVSISNADPSRIIYYGGKEKTDTRLLLESDAVSGGNPTWAEVAVPYSKVDSEQFNYNTYMVADQFTAGQFYVGNRDVFRLTVDAQNTLTAENLTNNFVYVYNSDPMVMKFEWKFQPAMAKAHSDQQNLAFAGNSATFFISQDGGLQRTTDTGATFSKDLNSTLGLTQIIGLAVNPTDSAKLYIGTQDNGNQRRVSGTQWNEFVGGDGGQTRVDPTDPSRVFTSYIYGEITRVEADGTGAQTEINPQNFGTKRRTAFYPPIVTNSTDSTLYVGANTLAICTNCATVSGVGNWTFPANGTGAELTRDMTDTLSAIGVQKSAFSNTQTIYTGSSTGAFQVSQDGGATFTNRTGILDTAINSTSEPGRFITSIKVNPTTPGTAYITVSGFGTNHLFTTKDFGATITAMNFTVDIPVSDFVIDPTAVTTFYIGTDIGIYRSTDAGASWNQFNDGIPPVVVMRLESTNVNGSSTLPNGAQAANNSILAGTYGRGVFQNIILAPTAAPVSVNGRAVSLKGRSIAGAVVTMTDLNGEVRYARTNSFGYYNLSDVVAGQTYVFAVRAKNYQFAPQTVSLTDNLDGLNFTAH